MGVRKDGNGRRRLRDGILVYKKIEGSQELALSLMYAGLTISVHSCQDKHELVLKAHKF